MGDGMDSNGDVEEEKIDRGRKGWYLNRFLNFIILGDLPLGVGEEMDWR